MVLDVGWDLRPEVVHRKVELEADLISRVVVWHEIAVKVAVAAVAVVAAGVAD